VPAADKNSRRSRHTNMLQSIEAFVLLDLLGQPNPGFVR
jgi:hypothetical protein